MSTIVSTEMSQERDALGNVMTDSNGLPTHEAWGVAEIPDENPDLSSVKIEFWAYGRKPGVADISTLKGWIKGTLTAPLAVFSMPQNQVGKIGVL